MRPLLAAALLAAVLCAPAAQRRAGTIVVVGANQSFNWAGYVQGALEKGKTFHAVAADWIVPTARQRNAGEAEYSATWIGIGGGCVDASCAVTDATLIQAGTGQDVDAAGNVDYYAWWETIPAPSVRTSLAVGAGDRIHVDIAEDPLTPEVWTITIRDVSRGSVFTITLPYTSTYATAEWVLETPVVISSNGAITVGPIPSLSTVHFDLAAVNGANAALVASEEMQLIDFNGSLIAAPSSPDADSDGFNDCTYRPTCPAPGNELR